MRAGVISEPDFTIKPRNEYRGLDQVGIVALAESGKDYRMALQLAEQALLESADYTLAKSLLGRVLFLVPDHKRARKLLFTLSADPHKQLMALGLEPETFKPYTTKANDSVQSLARRFLGDDDYYPLLMKLNTLDSASLEGGQSLLLPAQEQRLVRHRQQAIVQNSTMGRSTGQDPQMAEADNQAEMDVEAEQAQDDDRASAPISEAESQMVADEEDAVSAPEAGRNEYSAEAKQALQAYARGERKAAYLMLKDQAGGRKGQVDALFLTLHRELVEEPYTRGLHYYQEQQLDLAIAEFNKVLSVEPEHGQALLYKARCTELLARLRTIE